VSVRVPRVDEHAGRVFVYAVHGEQPAEFLFSRQIKPGRVFVVPVCGDKQTGAFIELDDIVVRIQYRIIGYKFHILLL